MDSTESICNKQDVYSLLLMLGLLKLSVLKSSDDGKENRLNLGLFFLQFEDGVFVVPSYLKLLRPFNLGMGRNCTTPF